MKDTFCMAVGGVGARLCQPVRRLGCGAADADPLYGRGLRDRPDRGGRIPRQPQEPDRRAGEPCGLEGTDPQGRDPADRAGGLPAGRRDGNQLCAGRRGHRLYLQRDHFHR